MKKSIEDLKMNIEELKFRISYLTSAYNTGKNSYVSLIGKLYKALELNLNVKDTEWLELKKIDERILKCHIEKTKVEKELYKVEKCLYNRLYYEKKKEHRKVEYQKNKKK